MSDKVDNVYDVWFVCKICQEAFDNRKLLVDHLRIKHLGESLDQSQNSSSSDLEDHRDPDHPGNISMDVESESPKLEEDILTTNNFRTVEAIQTTAGTQSESNYPVETEIKIDTEVESEAEHESEFSEGQSELIKETSGDSKDISRTKRKTRDTTLTEVSPEKNALINMKRPRQSQNVDDSGEIGKPNSSNVVESAENSDLEIFMFYECNQCKKLYLSKTNVENHYKSDHSQQSPIPPTANYCAEKNFAVKTLELSCPVCHKKFNQIYDQIVHIASHAEENYLCLSQSQREEQRKSQVDSETAAAAPVKIRSARTSKNLKPKKRRQRHYNFPCKWCEKKFASSNLLRDHVGMHTGEKSHACKHCSKMFRFSSGLYRHMRQDHPN